MFSIPGRQRSHVRHPAELHLRDRQGLQAVHLPAQGRRRQAHHRRGARQEDGRKVEDQLFDRFATEDVLLSCCLYGTEDNTRYEKLTQRLLFTVTYLSCCA